MFMYVQLATNNINEKVNKTMSNFKSIGNGVNNVLFISSLLLEQTM